MIVLAVLVGFAIGVGSAMAWIVRAIVDAIKKERERCVVLAENFWPPDEDIGVLVAQIRRGDRP